ncbi:MAG: hypothetical protein ACOZNI_11850 [Myxococcota bacterium]
MLTFLFALACVTRQDLTGEADRRDCSARAGCRALLHLSAVRHGMATW